MNSKPTARRVSERLRRQPQSETPKKSTFNVVIYPQAPISNLHPLDNHCNELQFTRFQQLPLELRTEIFTLSLPGPRIIEFFTQEKENPGPPPTDFRRNMAKSVPPIAVPALLHCNQESRQFAQKLYKPCFSEYTTNGGPFYMDFEKDTILITLQRELVAFFGPGARKRGTYYLKSIRNLAIAGTPQFSIVPLKPFSGLRNVTFLRLGDITESYNVLAMDMIKSQWASEVKKKQKGGVKNAELNVELLSREEFKTRFRWDGIQRAYEYRP